MSRRFWSDKKILVVDDERHIVRLAQVNLERAGYEVVTASGGKEALEKIELENPDLIVLDAMMPYLDGFEVLDILRKNPATRELPVIMLLALPATGVSQTWQSALERSGVDAYLSKPPNPMELISIVKRIFAARDGSEE
ncbi:MAG: Response regulator consisting of a CheY-like receiver domain and a winged-helix DNA-binding domain [Chthonomonadaceae bacterium]|nr:Response regulator consisting of a CheY-like receiver domain and a winged-helix DNA-binding domain [Chthonomonadaceae bacterium]